MKWLKPLAAGVFAVVLLAGFSERPASTNAIERYNFMLVGILVPASVPAKGIRGIGGDPNSF